MEIIKLIGLALFTLILMEVVKAFNRRRHEMGAKILIPLGLLGLAATHIAVAIAMGVLALIVLVAKSWLRQTKTGTTAVACARVVLGAYSIIIVLGLGSMVVHTPTLDPLPELIRPY